MNYPVNQRIEETVPALGAAVAGDTVVGDGETSGRVTKVTFTPEAAVVAHAANNKTLRLINKGQSGAGSTVIASLALDTPGDDNLVAFDERTIPITGDPAVAHGDVLVWDEVVVGSGVATPGGKVEVELSRS